MSTTAIMFTFTTYGTWLRGDARGWVDDGVTFPACPPLEALDRSRLKYPPYYFPREVRIDVAREMVVQLKQRLRVPVYAICLQSWHSHVVTGGSRHHFSEIAKCAKDAATHLLKLGRRAWGRDYDKRFCFDDHLAHVRIRYVEKHNEEDGFPARLFDILDYYQDR
jgi:hypothetical protein